MIIFFPPNSVATLGVLTVGVKGLVFIRGGLSHTRAAFLTTIAAQKLIHLLFLTEVANKTVARRPLAQPSRHTGTFQLEMRFPDQHRDGSKTL